MDGPVHPVWKSHFALWQPESHIEMIDLSVVSHLMLAGRDYDHDLRDQPPSIMECSRNQFAGATDV